MSLSKGATFHVPSSPPIEDDPVLSVPHLAHRSPTCSSSSLVSLLFDKEGVAAQSIKDFESTFSGARGRRLGSHRRHRRTTSDLTKRLQQYSITSTPTDEGLGTSVSGGSEKNLASSFDRVLELHSDSGLGTSIGNESTKEEPVISVNTTVIENASEDDGLSVKDLFQGWRARCALMSSDAIDTLSAGADLRLSVPRQTRQRGTPAQEPAVTRSAVTQSIAPQGSTHIPRQPHLNSLARQTLSKNIFHPLLREDRFTFFHPLVTSLRAKTGKGIKCLRDLEQSLVFEPLVSIIIHLRNQAPTYPSSQPQALAVPQQLYRSFSEFVVQLTVDTYRHLSEPEQRRAADRPYDNGYFLDLVQQVGRLAAQIGSARQAKLSRQTEEETADDEMAYSPYVSPSNLVLTHHSHRCRDDEVTLEGGVGETGHPAELVRWKNGKGISLRNNLPYEPQPSIKRQHSMESMDDDVERSMARRKKNAEPKIIELKCCDRTCDKVFTRKCDLAKHEKTHSRPFKCPDKACKYHEQGLPTEKERDRHVNDKHDPNPRYYYCTYCNFKTKRDSNCKQHMEKKHGWQYDRVKGIAKTVRTPGQTPQTPSMDYSPATGSPAPSNMGWGASSASASAAGSSAMVTPLEQAVPSFDGYSPASNQPYALFPREQQHYTPSYSSSNHDSLRRGSLPQQTVSTSYNYGQNMHTSPMSPFTTTPATPGSGAYSYGQSPYNSYNIDINLGQDYAYNTGMPTPNPNYLQPTSRNPSLSYNSPLDEPTEQFFTMPPPAPTMQANLDTFSGHNDLPSQDFELFADAGNARSVAADMMGDMDMDFTYTAEDGLDIDDFLNIPMKN